MIKSYRNQAWAAGSTGTGKSGRFSGSIAKFLRGSN